MAYTPGQEKCINTLDRSLVVAAGAGSGKTFTLTKRIVHAIQCGAVDDIDRVCAITFTNKAAGELKSRIKAELRACGLIDQALRVDDAWVSTIHGMCARILRAHAIELDLDPAFQMVDPVEAALLRDGAIDAVLERAQAGGIVEADLAGEAQTSGAAGVDAGRIDALFAEYPAQSYGPRGTSVGSMLRTLMDAAGSNARGFEAFVTPEVAANPASLVDAVVQAYETLADAALAQKPNEARETWAACVQEQARSIRSEMETGHASDPVWAIHALDKLPFPKRVGTADYKEQVAQAIEVYQMCVMELRLAAASPHLETLVVLAREAQAAYAAAKRAQGVLDNNDLLVLAYDAVANHPEIAALYADRFQLIMVDEFQDTDQMQVDMIKMLAGPGACRLCTVGDAQQSIYRFRGADVAVYRRHLEKVRAGGPDDVIMLPDNFRSHADVLSLVDRVFEKPDMFGGGFMSLAASREESRVKRPFAVGLPRIQVQLTSNAYRGVPTAHVREVAAARVADALAGLCERGHSAGEMAVLLGSMTYAGVYAAALRKRGLACVVAGGSVFSQTPEAQLVADLARVAANPEQTQALHNVLISPMFGLSAGDLLELSTYVDGDGAYRRGNLARGLSALSQTLRSGKAPSAWSPQLALAVRVMGDFVDDAGRLRVSQLAMRALLDSGWLSRLQEAGPEGLASAANAYKAVRMIEDIEAQSAAGPARVARVFEAMLSESKEAPGALSSTGGDFVRIMTVHASKGLEFPIVAVAEFRETSGPSDRLLASEAEGNVYLSLDLGNTVANLDGPAKLKELPSLYASMTEGYDDEDGLVQAIARADGALAQRAALYERDRLGDAEESKRLLYVALTRAKEALVVSLIGKRTKENPLATPKNCLGALAGALAAADGGFAVGTSRLEYGGSAPALVEHIALEVDGESGEGEPESVDDADNAAEGAGVAGGTTAPGPFMVPTVEGRLQTTRVPYAPAHEGVFSYSSISDASHEGDMLERLAETFLVSVDGSAQDQVESSWDPVPEDGRDGLASADLFAWNAGSAATVEDDDGSWAYAGAATADADKATDLGTAFHRLAQYAVATRGTGALVRPPRERIESLARSCKLDGVQMDRLEAALDRWFASDVAEEMSGFDDLSAEVPFFVGVPPQAPESFLEGEIDLLGVADGGKRAVVVDYKTGGNDGESAEALAKKHVLQATCYAYAIMLQGASSVDAVFVRVERGRADDPFQPQCVRYRFAVQAMPALEQAIAEAYALGKR